MSDSGYPLSDTLLSDAALLPADANPTRGRDYEWPRLGRYSVTSVSAANNAASSPSCWATNTPMTCRHNSGTLTSRASAMRLSPATIDVVA